MATATSSLSNSVPDGSARSPKDSHLSAGNASLERSQPSKPTPPTAVLMPEVFDTHKNRNDHQRNHNYIHNHHRDHNYYVVIKHQNRKS